jgi:hypothetical protein
LLFLVLFIIVLYLFGFDEFLYRRIILLQALSARLILVQYRPMLVVFIAQQIVEVAQRALASKSAQQILVRGGQQIVCLQVYSGNIHAVFLVLACQPLELLLMHMDALVLQLSSNLWRAALGSEFVDLAIVLILQVVQELIDPQILNAAVLKDDHGVVFVRHLRLFAFQVPFLSFLVNLLEFLPDFFFDIQKVQAKFMSCVLYCHCLIGCFVSVLLMPKGIAVQANCST